MKPLTAISLASGIGLMACASQQPMPLDSAERMTLEAATEIALKNLPGEILESELDNEEGPLAYDFEILKADGSIWEIEINAIDGTVLNIEED